MWGSKRGAERLDITLDCAPWAKIKFGETLKHHSKPILFISKFMSICLKTDNATWQRILLHLNESICETSTTSTIRSLFHSCNLSNLLLVGVSRTDIFNPLS